jgi:uncharacterized membrane protein
MAESIYLNDVPKEYQKTDKDVLLLFNGEAFKGKTIVVNDKDSLSFKSQPGASGCYGVRFKKISKSTKKIKLSVKGRKDITISILEKYEYIDIGDDYDKNKWGVVYNKILPSFFCM